MAETSIFQANNSSIILNGLYKKPDNLISQVYSSPMSYPNLFKQIKPIEIDQAVTGTFLNSKQIRVSLPRSGLLRGLIIQTDLNYAVTTETGALYVLSDMYGSRSPGMNIYEKIELRTSSQTLCTNTAQSLVLTQEISDSSKSLTQLKMSQFIYTNTKNFVNTGVATGSAAVFRTYTCFNSPFFASPNQYFDTSLWENLFLYLYTVPAAVNSYLNSRFTTGSVKVFGYYEFLNPISLEKLRADMSQLTEAVSMLTYSFYTENTVVTGTTTMDYIVKSVYPAFLTSLDITCYNAFIPTLPSRINIKTVKFDFSGQLYDTMDTNIINYENGVWGASMFSMGNTELTSGAVAALNAIPLYLKCYDNPKLWFNLEGKNGFMRNSGSLAYQQSNSPKFTLVYNDGLTTGSTEAALGTAANYQLFVTHAYYTVTSFNAQSGLVTISATT